MRSVNEASQAEAQNRVATARSHPAKPGTADTDEEVECSKCHMYFGLRATIEAHEKRHAQHDDDELESFQNPKDYSVIDKPLEKTEHSRKQKGLERALKTEKPEVSEDENAPAPDTLTEGSATEEQSGTSTVRQSELTALIPNSIDNSKTTS